MSESAQPRLKLYHATPSRSTTVLWMLEELGEPFEIEWLRLKEGDQLKPEYLAINPMGKVPTLIDGESVVTEVSAICCYLADAYPQAGLAPTVHDTLRGPYLKWLFFAPSCLEPAMIDKAMNRPAVPRSVAGWADYDTTVSVLREAVGKASPFLLGEKFSAADVVIGSSVRWFLQFKLLPDFPEFVAYAERLGQRPALQRQLARDEAFTRQTTA